MSLSVIFSNTYSGNATILNDAGMLSTSFTGNNMYVREATMHIERNGTPVSVAYVMQILDNSNNVLATSRPYSIQNLIDEFRTAQRGEPHFVFDGTFKVNSGTTYKLAIKRFSGSGSNIWVHQPTTGTGCYCVIWGSTIESGGYTPDWNNVPFIHCKGSIHLNASTSPTDPKQCIEICSDPPNITSELDVVQLLRQPPNPNDWYNYNIPKSAALKFKSNLLEEYTCGLFQVNAHVGDPNTWLVSTHTFLVRKDLLLNGMLVSYEGAIQLHGGTNVTGNNNRTWGTQRTRPNGTTYSSLNPVIVKGPPADNTDSIEFIEWPATINDPWSFVPIKCKSVYTSDIRALEGYTGVKIAATLLDSNGNSGVSGQVLTSTGGGTGPIWQAVSNSVPSGVKAGQVTTDVNGNATVTFSPALGSEPSITCTVKDTNGRPITVIITAASASGFTIKTMVHKHFIGTVEAKQTNPLTNHTHPINALNETLTNTTNVNSHQHQFSRAHFGGSAGNSGSTQVPTSNVPSHVRPLYLRDGLGNTIPIGGSMIQPANSGEFASENLLYTGPMSSNNNSGTIQEQIGSIIVNWVAIPKTQ